MDNRRMATPHYRGTRELARLRSMAIVAFIAGAMMGVTLAMAWHDLAGGI